MALLFKQLAMQVEFASNGQEAVDLFSLRHHALILMDIHMPRMSGIEAAQHIRSNFADDQQPIIIALTAQAGDSQVNYTDLGFNGVLNKPLKSDTLRSVLNRYLPQPQQEQSFLPPTSPKQTSKSRKPEANGVDESVLDEMLADLGEENRDLLFNLINTYLKHTPALLADMERALAADDLITLHRAAHTLKSSSACVGVMRLSKLAKHLESQLKSLLNTPLNSQELGKIKKKNRVQVAVIQAGYEQASAALQVYQLKLNQK